MKFQNPPLRLAVLALILCFFIGRTVSADIQSTAAGASAECNDGMYSTSTRSGTCSHHGGVKRWLNRSSNSASNSRSSGAHTTNNYEPSTPAGPSEGYHTEKGAPSYVPNGYAYDAASNSFVKVGKGGKREKASTFTDWGPSDMGKTLLVDSGNYRDGATKVFVATKANWSIMWDAGDYGARDGYFKVWILNKYRQTIGQAINTIGGSESTKRISLPAGTYYLYIQTDQSWALCVFQDTAPTRRYAAQRSAYLRSRRHAKKR